MTKNLKNTTAITLLNTLNTKNNSIIYIIKIIVAVGFAIVPLFYLKMHTSNVFFYGTFIKAT